MCPNMSLGKVGNACPEGRCLKCVRGGVIEL